MTRLNEKTVNKIYSMTAAGKTPAEIADSVNAEYGTVYYHVKKARETETSKLDVQPKDYELPMSSLSIEPPLEPSSTFKGLSLAAALMVGFAIGAYFGTQFGAL